jgi:hypothetical protein
VKIKSCIITVLAVAALGVFGCNKEKAPSGMSLDGSQGLPPGHPSMDMKSHPKIDTQSKIAIAPGSIRKAAGGYTVAEVYAKKAALNGKSVKVRGKVIKFNANIMSRNWLHVQDGSGQSGTNDLTVTTISKAEVGQTVLIEGKLAADKDFGSGYKYSVIVEGATVSVEK